MEITFFYRKVGLSNFLVLKGVYADSNGMKNLYLAKIKFTFKNSPI